MRQEYIVQNPPSDELSENNVNLDDKPLVSFCIPTLNDASTIRKCLSRIKSQTYDNLEIVIVDGGSSDGTVEIAREFTDDIYFDDAPLGGAREKSIEESDGSILALFDADVYIPDEYWLQRNLNYFNYSNIVSTVWPKAIAPPGSSNIAQLYSDHSQAIFQHRISDGSAVVGGGNSLFLRSAVQDVGGFNENVHWGEDFELGIKLKDAGYQVVQVDSVLYHDTMRTWQEFLSTQITGSRSFSDSGFENFGISTVDILYEQYVVGIRQMFVNVIQGNSCWIFFPPYIIIKSLIYAHTFLSDITTK